eukprot:TRINITY_DN15049_c0_g1_i1.p1 TRINITY_DN15049_c0_g1~~TRINITY_DN15049_c0_g1_i1.p1  ORF type:complete len:343 (+),score=107.51 TRINITY_DN15049_c0_g1_i1:52-1080(+)
MTVRTKKSLEVSSSTKKVVEVTRQKSKEAKTQKKKLEVPKQQQKTPSKKTQNTPQSLSGKRKSTLKTQTTAQQESLDEDFTFMKKKNKNTSILINNNDSNPFSSNQQVEIKTETNQDFKEDGSVSIKEDFDSKRVGPPPKLAKKLWLQRFNSEANAKTSSTSTSIIVVPQTEENFNPLSTTKEEEIQPKVLPKLITASSLSFTSLSPPSPPSLPIQLFPSLPPTIPQSPSSSPIVSPTPSPEKKEDTFLSEFNHLQNVSRQPLPSFPFSVAPAHQHAPQQDVCRSGYWPLLRSDRNVTSSLQRNNRYSSTRKRPNNDGTSHHFSTMTFGKKSKIADDFDDGY